MKKIILIGYPGSQRIVPASKYLVEKYMPGFEVTYLNYTGPIFGWSKYLADYLSTLSDKKIILALDDYLLEAPTDMAKFNEAWDSVEYEMVCVKLCENRIDEISEYPITTQYTIWNREFLISLLRLTTDPWNFEINGSFLFKRMGKFAGLEPCMYYNVHTALSNRWEGVRLDGLKYEDINYLINNKLL